MKHIHFITLLVLIVTGLFIWRVAYFQLATDKYILNAHNTSIKKEVTHPNRGDILDRNGRLLVSTSFKYDLDVNLNLLEEDFDTIGFCNLLGISKQEFIQELELVINDKKNFKKDIITFRKDLSRNEFAYLQEQISLYSAIEIVKRPKREYHVNTAGNILGYINEASPAYIKRDSNYYEPGDIVGIAGVEKSYETHLRGIKGVKHVLKNNSSKTIGSYKNGKEDIRVKSGSAITLTIDYDLQEYAESLLSNKRGAVVALDPNNGEILTLASAPTINPKHFLDPKLRSAILLDTIARSGYDRASQGTYPPGSTFKMVNGLAAMQMGVTSDSTAFTCRGGFHYGGRRLGCHDYGTFRVQAAVQNSCNTYFCRTFAAAVNKDTADYTKGLNEWSSIVKSFGLGNYLNNDLAVGSPGRIPGSEYYDTYLGEGTWSAYSIISNGIGQGDIDATPLQMANYTAAIANRGFFYTPHIVKEIDGAPIQDSNFIVPKKTLVDSKYFGPVIDGMKRVITRGTARKIRTKYLSQAGKTGTSENAYGQDHSLFVLFAPVEDPKIAVAVVIENGHYGATWAAPIASLVAEKYLNDEVKRTGLENRMKRGNLQYQYKRNWINYAKRKGFYVEPPKVDSVESDSVIQRH